MRTVAVILGEGAASEAMTASIALLDRMNLDIEWTYPPVGLDAEAEHGERFPGVARDMIDAADTTFFGATSGPSAAALFYLRWGKQTYANVRPTRYRRGFSSSLADPDDVDFVIVRENLEDTFIRLEGDLAELDSLGLNPTSRQRLDELGPGRYAIRVITEAGSERVLRFAFDMARFRKAAGFEGKVTVAAKTNLLPETDGLFARTGERIAVEYPDVIHESFIVDDFAHRMTASPQSLDVVVLPNLYGDILADAAAGLVGGLGLAPSACYGENYAYFESAHGTAPDIEGQGIVNPTATLLSAAMMLEYLGLDTAGRALVKAIDAVYAEGRRLTPDQDGVSSTEDFCDAVFASLEPGW